MGLVIINDLKLAVFTIFDKDSEIFVDEFNDRQNKTNNMEEDLIEFVKNKQYHTLIKITN